VWLIDKVPSASTPPTLLAINQFGPGTPAERLQRGESQMGHKLCSRWPS